MVLIVDDIDFPKDVCRTQNRLDVTLEQSCFSGGFVLINTGRSMYP